jgi:phage/plasmid primase-like uncharacterized protein
MTDLRDAMQQRGLTPPNDLEPGKFVRFSTNDKHSDRAGWCLLFPDGEGAIFGCHRNGWSEVWQAARSEPMTPEERKAWRNQVAQARRQAQAEREAEYKAAAQEAARIWEQAKPADPAHSYLRRKQVQPFGIRQDGDGRLVIPVYGSDGAIQSIQHISGYGDKRFLPGGKMAAGRFWLRKDGARILVGEGFATMASIAEAVPGAAVVVAFSAGNLKQVAQDVRKANPTAEIVLCADNDENGVGQSMAKAAAEAVGASVVICPAKTDFNDLHCQSGLDAVRKALERAPAPAPRPALKLDDGTWPEALDAAIEHLARGDQVFDYGGALVAIATDGSTFPVTAPWLCTLLERQFKAVKFDKRSAAYLPARVPLEFAQRLLAAREGWTFPKLRAVLRHRVMRLDGSILDRPGYDGATGLCLTTEGDAPAIRTDREALRKAITALWHPVSLMPYASPSDAGAALALLLTAVQRPTLPLAPLFIASAPVYSSGKTILGEVGSVLAGGDGRATVLGREEAEQEKALLSILMTGRPAVLLDNLEGTLRGAHLAAMLTAETFSGRLLGSSAMVELPTRQLWVATGVNLAPSRDLLRRSLTIRLDPGVERPEQRAFPFHPVTWTREHRAEMQSAALTIVVAAHRAGAANVPAPSIGSYEAWDRQIRRAVLWLIREGLAPCEMADPLMTMERERGDDPEVARLAAFLHGWHGLVGDRPMLAADVIARARENVTDPDCTEFLATVDEIAGVGGGHISNKRLAAYLRRHRGRITCGLVITKGAEVHAGFSWRVCEASLSEKSEKSDSSPPYAANCQDRIVDTYSKDGGTNPTNPTNPITCPACAGEGCSWCESTGVRP